MNKFKTFIIGVVAGSLLTGGFSYAADSFQIEVSFPKWTYWLDGKQIQNDDYHDGSIRFGSEDVPATISYKGVSYVPVRFLADGLGKEIVWDRKQERIDIRSVEQVPFSQATVSQVPKEISDWLQRSVHIELGQSRVYGNDTYILVTRGEKSTGGYTVEIEEIKQYASGYQVRVRYSDPPKGIPVIQPLTFPYAFVKVNRQLTGKPEFLTADGRNVPRPVGLDFIGTIMKESDNIVLFEPLKNEREWQFRGMVRSFEGMLNFGLTGTDGSIIRQESIQAAAGAPNWGYFTVSIPANEAGKAFEANFQLNSPKDGSAQETLSVELQ
ncbi:protease complex subunit PrcB family protein [Ferviditalea candida]|uniref:Protease complex subunit PrcB family protein n=1 Tax=Ferviditalea candida TaxID=3108399 RepID=A0ABU5ZCK3_9BACL|nr:protease complex subunit PrcB family protein [Paenibacillaceae bacterium T2]